MNTNPYAPPAEPSVIPEPASRDKVRDVAKRQREMIWAYVALIASRMLLGGFWFLAVFPALALVTFRLSRALGDRRPWLFALLALIPLANFLVFLSMSRRATNFLTSAGLTVGLFGAKSD